MVRNATAIIATTAQAAHRRFELKIVLSGGSSEDDRHDSPFDQIGNRPLSTSTVADRRDDVSVPQFLFINAMRGTALGISFAVFMLYTDMLGIFTLVMSQPAPAMTALIFVLVCCFKFIPSVTAIALTVAAYAK